MVYGLTHTTTVDGKIVKQDITIYEKNIETWEQKTANVKDASVEFNTITIAGEKINNIKYSKEEFRGSVAVHEATHATD